MGTAGVSIASAAAGEEDMSPAVETAAAVLMRGIVEVAERQYARTAVASLAVTPLQVAPMQQWRIVARLTRQ